MTENEAIRHLEDLQRLYLGNEKFTADVEAIGIAIKVLDQQPCGDCVRELMREFDKKHHTSFVGYMQEFNNHSISEIIEYMWDMHELIEDIEYRLPD